MKYVYCPSCDRISVLSNVEPVRCATCAKEAVPIRVRRSWHYWASAVLILTGAVVVYATNLPDLVSRFALLTPFLLFGVFFSTWGLRVSKETALREGRARKVKAE